MGRNLERDERVRAELKQKILEAAFPVFAEKGIEPVSMNEIASACGISYATLYRHYGTKAELVLAVNSRVWDVYYKEYHARRDVSKMNAAEEFDFYLDSFLDLYRNHRDLLRYNQFFNVFVANERVTPEQMEPYIRVISQVRKRFHEVYEDSKEKFGDTVKYKGIFRITVPKDENDEDWVKRAFEGNLWCVQESNIGYKWDWHEEKLKGKKVGINIRKRLYTYNGKNRETVEIARFETIDDVKNGKVKPMRDRDQRENKDEVAEESTDMSGFTDVSKDNEISVPW